MIKILTDEDRAAGKATQEQPEIMGKLKQRSIDKGMTLKEYFLWLGSEQASREQAQEIASKSNEVVLLRQEMVAMFEGLQKRITPEQIQAPQASGFSAIGEFADAMKSMKEYENTLISGYTNMRNDILGELATTTPDDIEPDSPEDYAQRKIIDALAGKFNSSNVGSGQTAANSKENNPSLTPPPVTNPQETQGGNMKLSDEQIKEVIVKVPEGIKEQLKSGDKTYKDFNEGVEQAGFGALDADSRKRLYEAIKTEGGTDATNESKADEEDRVSDSIVNEEGTSEDKKQIKS